VDEDGSSALSYLSLDLSWHQADSILLAASSQARMRIDGLPIDHCQGSSTTGPLAWITAGKLDGVIDIKFPRHPDDDVDFTSVLSEIIDNVQEIATSSSSNPTPTLSAPSPSPGGNVSSSSTKSAGREVINPGQRPLGKPALVAPEVSNWREMMLGKKSEQEMAREVVMDIDLRFRDLKAAVPYRAAELSYVNSALIRPIVAFIK
jgi:distribution and morphology protein 31